MSEKHTRWMDLFERDETLQPKGLHYEGGWWLVNPEIILAGEASISDEQAENMLIGHVVRWFNTKHEGLTLGDGHFDDKYSSPDGQWPFSGFSAQVWSPLINQTRSGENLIDALYELVLVVLEDWEKNLAPQKETPS